jgi:hypothetical protein
MLLVRFGGALALVVLLSVPATAQQIASISVCSAAGTGGAGSCPPGTFDTQKIVLAPDGSGAINKYAGMSAASDEHASVFAPGTLQNNGDYLFWVASNASGNPLGVVVLSGGSGPDGSGQWTMDFARADGYGSYPSGFGPLFLPPVGQRCPAAPGGNAAQQDQTFDLSYAAAGSVLIDSSSAPGNLLMIYEGSNSCIGIATNTNPSSGSYITVAVATSNDYGHTWPTYRGTASYSFVALPAVSKAGGPAAGMGAAGSSVCMGNDCTAAPPAAYGRYAVVGPQTPLAPLMSAGKELGDILGDGEISGFVDDAAAGTTRYIYAVHGYKPSTYDPPLPDARSSDLMMARAPLNGGTAPLTFLKWNGQAFASPGLGGADAAILPDGAYQSCGALSQQRHQASINYVDDAKQYLLTFVCDSPTDPATGHGAGNAKGAAWFFSTSPTLSDPRQWSVPQEIAGSWSEFNTAGGCLDFQGWYPTLISLDARPGHLTRNGYVFYMWGCQGGGAPGGRQYSSRAVTMTFAPRRRAAKH